MMEMMENMMMFSVFIAEGGPECFQEKQEQIQECVTKTFGDEYQFNTENITANSIPEISFGVSSL